MDEPSTGLDPASRYNLWNVVKQSKQDRAIILTSKPDHASHTLMMTISSFNWKLEEAKMVNGRAECE